MISVREQDAQILLHTLLKTGGWRSNDETILEAFPHMADELNQDDLRQTLENLRLPISEVRCRETEITRAECPALVLPDGGRPFVVLDRTEDGLVIEEVGHPGECLRAPRRRMVQVLCIEVHRRRGTEHRAANVTDTLVTLRPMLPWLLSASFFTNCLGLLTPLLIMAIYDRVIPAGSVDLLVSMAIGVAIVLATDFGLRSARSAAIAYVGRKMEKALSVALFRKLMALPLQQMQKSDVHQQVARFRQFEALRDVFTGQAMSSLLDLPFALIFLAVLMYIAPQVGLMTLFAVIVLVVISCVAIPIQKRLDADAETANETSRSVLQDAVIHQSAMVNLGLAETWQLRSAPLAEAAERATRRARQFQTSTQSLAQTVSALAGLAAIVVSAQAALAGALSFGALIAVIALVSKVIAPLHAMLASVPQILVYLKSKAQADRVLSLNEEFELGLENSFQKTLEGAVQFNNVTFRPDPLSQPLLNQVSFSVEPGELVVVMGNAAGRAAVLDLVNGLSAPLAGTIEHDTVDIRQIARDELRRSVAVMRQDSAFFYGTVAQNFRLGNAALTEADMTQALAHAGLDGDVESLPEGLHTRLKDDAATVLPEHCLNALSLARSLSRAASINLFSDPTNGLSSHSRECFKSWLNQNKGRRTIYVATSDTSLLHFADRFLFLNEGRLVVNDTGAQGLKKIKAALQSYEETG